MKLFSDHQWDLMPPDDIKSLKDPSPCFRRPNPCGLTRVSPATDDFLRGFLRFAGRTMLEWR
ncbi:MAG: hypothetical protein ACON38_08465, partial [Akkermansiaceae bacterium]